MNEQNQPWECNPTQDKGDVPMITVEVQAFTPTKEAPWLKKVEVSLHEHPSTFCFDLGNVAQAVGAYPQATQLYGTSIQVFRSLGDLSAAEQALLQLRNLFLRQGDKERAKRLDLTLLNLRSEKGHSSH